MNLNQTLNYLGDVDVEHYHVAEPCESCGKKYKVSYSTGDPENRVDMCGRCLVKYARSYKEWCERGVLGAES